MSIAIGIGIGIMWSIIVAIVAIIIITKNTKSIAAVRKDLRKKINDLEKDIYERRIFFDGKYSFTLEQLQNNPNLIDFFSWDDLPQFEKVDLFAQRENTPGNDFHRKLFEIPAEALRRKFKISSGKEFVLGDFKNRPRLFKNFSEEDFEKFSPKGDLFKPRETGIIINLADFKERRNQPKQKTG